jgi:hypothetical protein
VKKTRDDWLDGRAASLVSEEALWTKLWKSKVPAKIHIFFWRLAHCSLPTGDVRHWRQMASSNGCSICGQEDSWRHTLIECMTSRCVWALADSEIVEHISMTTEPAARQWLFSMIESMKQEEFRRMALRHARRKLIHGDIHQSPMATHMFVESCLCRTLGIVRIRRLKRVTDELVLCQGGVRRCWESARSMLMGLLPKPYEEELSVRSASRRWLAGRHSRWQQIC